MTLDMEALVGDPTNTETDQEVTLYPQSIRSELNDLKRIWENCWNVCPQGRWHWPGSSSPAKITPTRILYLSLISILMGLKDADKAEGSDLGPEAKQSGEEPMPEGLPRSFAPKDYVPADEKSLPEGAPSYSDQPSSSSNVGASAKAHDAKARPGSPAPNSMPEDSSSSKQPPTPPPVPRKSSGKGKYSSQHDDQYRSYDQSQSYQSPIYPRKGEKGKGKSKSSKAYDKGLQGSYKGKGWGHQHKGGWDWLNFWTSLDYFPEENI